MFEMKYKALLLFTLFFAIYMMTPIISSSQCNQKIFFKMDKYAQSEGNVYIREFMIQAKSVINETKKTYKLKLDKGKEYTFYLSAKQSELYAKLTLYDTDLNLTDSTTNWKKQKYNTLQFTCKKTDIYVFEISGMKKKVSSKKICIPVILTFAREAENME